jgi:hypothetical protein
MKQQEMGKTLRIPVHSQIDLITNSSTEIFVHSENSIEPAKELLSELLKLYGSDQKVDDVFTLSIQINDERLFEFFDYLCEEEDEELWEELGLENLRGKEREEKIQEVVSEIKLGKREMPDSIDDSSYETYLVVTSKDPKYDKFLKLLENFLYSPDYFEYSNN